MKKGLLVIFLLACASTVYGYELLGTSFTAPSVDGTSKVKGATMGDIVYDWDADAFRGYDKNGAWQSFSSSASSPVPAGVISAYAGATAPTGYLICDGTAVSRTTYSNLFAAIGVVYGSGDGSTTFNLPNAKGVFLRGAGTQTIGSVSYTGTMGTTQNDATKKNGLSLNDPGHSHNILSSPSGGANGAALSQANSGQYGSTIVSNTTGITLGSGDAETRPANITVNYIIKY